MPKFKYTALAPDGTTIRGVEDAVTSGMLQNALLNRDLDPIEVSEKRSILELELTKKKVKRRDLMHFSRQMAVFIRAGIPILDALDVIIEEVGDNVLRKGLLEVTDDLQAGATFADAAANQPQVFPSFYLNILKSAELTGNLDTVLDQLSEYIERDLEARQKIVSAVTYPAVVTVMSLMAVVVLVAYVLPKFEDFFVSFDAELPLPTRMILAISDFFSAWGAVLAIVVVVAGVGTAVALRTEWGRTLRDTMVLRTPVLGDVVRHAVLERFCRILSSMVGAGVPLPDALAVTSQATNNRVYRQGLAVAREKMMGGEGLAEPLSETGLFPAAARQMFKVGENTGTLDKQMEVAADYFRRELDHKLKRFTNLFEPAVIVFAGALVGFIAIALVSAMYGIFDQVQI